MNDDRPENAAAWVAPWSMSEPEDDADRVALEAELARELRPGHALHGLPVRLIGRGMDDDAAFELLDGTGRVVVVHLTWHGAAEQLPFPGSQWYASFAEFRGERILQDSADVARRVAAALPAPSSPQVDPAVTRAPRPADRLKMAAVLAATFLGSAGFLAWQWLRAIGGESYSPKGVIVFTGIVVVLLGGAVGFAAVRVFPGLRGPLASRRRRGNVLVAVLAIIGLTAGFADGAAMAYVADASARAGEATRARLARDRQAENIRLGTTPVTPVTPR